MKGKALSVILGMLLLGGCSLTPEPLSKQEMLQQAKEDMQFMFSHQVQPVKPITLEEAIARALKYNLNNRVSMMEEAVARGVHDLSRFDLLPQLTAKAGYSWRNNYTGATSQSLIDGTQSLVASTSQELGHYTTSIGASWNILDFGVSYANARQAGNQVLITEQLRRKSVQNIVRDVTFAWWSGVVAQEVMDDLNDVLLETRDALQASKEVEHKQLKSPEEVIRNQKDLLDLLNRLLRQRKQMRKALAELGTLMNLKPGTPFRLAVPKDVAIHHLPKLPLEQLEYVALQNRPEIQRARYEKRVSVLETKKTLLRLFPGLSLSYDYNYDTNKFTYFPYWNQTGVRISWNIFNLFTFPERYRQGKTREELEDLKRLALSIGILSSVNLAWQDYYEVLGEYYMSKEQLSIEGKLEKIAEASRRAKRGSAFQKIMTRVRFLNAKISRGLAYADLEGAYLRLFHATGVDITPPVVPSYNIETLTEAVRLKLDAGNADLMRAVEEVSGHSLPAYEEKENQGNLDALFELLFAESESSLPVSQRSAEPAAGRSVTAKDVPGGSSAVASWVQEGKRLMQAGRYAAALRVWGKGVRSLPADTTLYRLGVYSDLFSSQEAFSVSSAKGLPLFVYRKEGHSTSDGVHYLLLSLLSSGSDDPVRVGGLVSY